MKFLIPVLVGSLIGYLTNWLAIKMLFRPHYEKKLFGIAIPFTPGLIPKERNRMAKNIGEAVGMHLLSTDTIIEAISDSENEAKIKAWLNDKIEKLRHDESTVDEFLEAKIGNDYQPSKIKLEEKTSEYLVNFIRREEFKISLNSLIDENIERYDTETLYRNISVNAKSFVEKLRDSDNLRLEIKNVIDNTLEKALTNDSTIEGVIPSDVFDSLDRYLSDHKDQIGDNIRAVFKDQDVREKIQYTLANVIFDRSNKLLMAFISPDMISEKIFESLEKYIDKRETNDDILEIIKFIVEKIKIKKISNISGDLSKIIDGISMDPIFDKLINNILKEDNIDKSLDALTNILNQSESSNKQVLKTYLFDEIDKIIASEYIEVKIVSTVESSLDILANKNLADLFTKLDDKVFANIYNFSKKIFNRFAEDELPKIIEMLNVSKIVEDKINSFEIDYTEKLILDIASKELNQITRLGALLGGVLGLLSPLLQYIY